MSSIRGNGNDSSNVARRAQQEYQQKEQNLIKKHQREVQRLNQEHQKVVGQLQKEQSETLDNYRDQTRTTLTERDVEYQKKMQDLRDMHREQLKKLAHDSDRKLETLNHTRKSEFEKMQSIADRQKDLLRTRHESDLKEVTGRFDSYVQRSQEEQKQARENIEKRLGDAHQKRLAEYTDSHNDQLIRTQNDLENIRETKGEEIKRLKESLVTQREDLSSSHMNQIRMEQDRHQVAMKDRQVSFTHSLDRMKGKYNKAIEEEKLTSEAHRQNLAETTVERQRETTRALERRIQELRLANTAGFQDLKKQYELEKANLADNFNTQVEILEKQKREALASYNRTNHKDNHRIMEEFGERFRQNNAFHMNKLDDLERRHSEQLQTLLAQAEQKQIHTEQRADKRFGVFKDKTEFERKEREEYFKDAIIEARRGFEEQLRDQRIKNTQEKQDMVARFREEMARSENAHNERYYRKVNEYEKQLQEINDRQVRELRSMNKRHQALLKQEERKSEMEKETLGLSFRDKLEQIKNTHRQELERLKERHQQELQRLAVATRTS